MKLSFTFETGDKETTPEVDSSAAWAQIVDAWRKVGAASGTDRDERTQWVGGAVAVYATLTGEDAKAVLDRLQRENPLQQQVSPPGFVEFSEGRSAPPPPRSPGAQRVVEEPLDEDVGGVSTS